MYSVREATQEDVEWLVTIAAKRMLVEEVKKPHYYNASNIEKLVVLGIEHKTLWVVTKDGELVGALGALSLPNVYNPTIKTLVELFWWVAPTHRDGRAGLLLLNMFIDCAAKYDTSTLSLLFSSNVLQNSLEKRGYILSELGFVKENTWQQ